MSATDRTAENIAFPSVAVHITITRPGDPDARRWSCIVPIPIPTPDGTIAHPITDGWLDGAIVEVTELRTMFDTTPILEEPPS